MLCCVVLCPYVDERLSRDVVISRGTRGCRWWWSHNHINQSPSTDTPAWPSPECRGKAVA